MLTNCVSALCWRHRAIYLAQKHNYKKLINVFPLKVYSNGFMIGPFYLKMRISPTVNHPVAKIWTKLWKGNKLLWWTNLLPDCRRQITLMWQFVAGPAIAKTATNNNRRPSRVVEHPKSKSTKPSLRGHGTPCTECRTGEGAQDRKFSLPPIILGLN